MHLSMNTFLINLIILSVEYLAYVCIVIALVSTISTNAFPFYFDDISSPIINDPYAERREVFDPYGFNSILTRYVDRDRLHNAIAKRTVRLLYRDEYDYN